MFGDSLLINEVRTAWGTYLLANQGGTNPFFEGLREAGNQTPGLIWSSLYDHSADLNLQYIVSYTLWPVGVQSVDIFALFYVFLTRGNFDNSRTQLKWMETVTTHHGRMTARTSPVVVYTHVWKESYVVTVRRLDHMVHRQSRGLIKDHVKDNASNETLNSETWTLHMFRIYIVSCFCKIVSAMWWQCKSGRPWMDRLHSTHFNMPQQDWSAEQVLLLCMLVHVWLSCGGGTKRLLILWKWFKTGYEEESHRGFASTFQTFIKLTLWPQIRYRRHWRVNVSLGLPTSACVK